MGSIQKENGFINHGVDTVDGSEIRLTTWDV